ncbi:helix-turn-helix domain-containing protein [Streptomyces luteireticuli]|uniref:helix-turn-helix domain-containing protein n=1 Tax=Streptomyces luteireticuli TaxID=173858 RepID=UPI0035571E5B
MTVATTHRTDCAGGLGVLMRTRRNARHPRMTQAELGAALGYTASWVCRVEKGELVPSGKTLAQIGHVLGIPPDELISAAHPPERGRTQGGESPGAVMVVAATLTTGHVEDQQEVAVRRRHFFTGVVGIGTAVAVGAPAAAQGRGPSLDSHALLEEALFQPPAVEPVPLGQLAGALRRSREDFRQSRYAHLAAGLPNLLATADATRHALNGHQHERACALAAGAYSLAGELAIKLRFQESWVAADRAMAAARASAEPAPLGEAARVLAVARRHAGRHRQAVDLLTSTSRDLADDPTAQAQAVRAAMLLTCGFTAAHYGDRTAALDMVGEAEEIGRRITHSPGLEKVTALATPAQCDGFRLSIFNTLGTDEGVAVVRRIRPGAFPAAERRARLFTDTARMWHRLGDHERTYAALRAIEQQAPEEARRPSVRLLTSDLMNAPVNLPGLAGFAVRTGAVHG